jgi:hypothetical protein
VYHPPDSSPAYKTIDHVSYVQQVTDKIEHLVNTRGPTTVVGNLNCPDVDWNTLSAPLDELQRAVCDFCLSDSHEQYVKEPTHINNILDAAFKN